MTGRPTAEIVADLRCVTDGNGWPAVVYEAADRLTELDAKVANANKMVLLIEAYIYDPHRISQGGLVTQIQRYMTDQDVEYLG